ncbi:ArsC/Spx/MgsR family protein [Comamonas sp. JC664]|uniref:ArsC/Spx/MgsR family protein n=1 Tax=Comamonas sp. JC664 TaxID=2801917 RepID=UPI0036167E3E
MSDAELIAQIAAHPELLNRPIVVSAKGARLCRRPSGCSICSDGPGHLPAKPQPCTSRRGLADAARDRPVRPGPHDCGDGGAFGLHAGHTRRPPAPHPASAIGWVLGMVTFPYLFLPLFLVFGPRKAVRPPAHAVIPNSGQRRSSVPSRCRPGPASCWRAWSSMPPSPMPRWCFTRMVCRPCSSCCV